MEINFNRSLRIRKWCTIVKALEMHLYSIEYFRADRVYFDFIDNLICFILIANQKDFDKSSIKNDGIQSKSIKLKPSERELIKFICTLYDFPTVLTHF